MIPKDLKGKPVLVIWDDASSDLEDHPDVNYIPHLVYTVGILAKKTKAGIVLFTDYEPASKEYALQHNIPKGMIKEIIPLS